ncbi:SAM-dependent methyltransferase [Coniella lustricola]|uniref:SAM-dependent methyltransferase n=1 Tax=Coniella lustricola TaxID=2025994 RepID=A0A2T2ZZW8_9PEZI|nr:SAM-dependent methyltransferase [Coniella lustricola]
MPISKAEVATEIASLQLLPPNGLAVEVAQATHRLEIISSWDQIKPGSKVLEIGCGQGNCTAVLAHTVGPDGHVDALDPAPPNYGSPFTLAQAQGHISASKIGDRVTWHRASLDEYLRAETPEKRWDVAVLSHSIWYFKSQDTLVDILKALRAKVSTVCLAEYALRATERAAMPHLLAAIARGTLEAHKTNSSQNIQTLFSPDAIRDIAEATGWRLEKDAMLVPEQGLLDGSWETGSVLGSGFTKDVNEITDSKVRLALQAMQSSVKAAIATADCAKKIRTMDVWVAAFEVDGH